MKKVFNKNKIYFYDLNGNLSKKFEHKDTFPDLLRILDKISKEDENSMPLTMSLHFIDSDRIKELNFHHRGIDKSTDVLSFPFNDYDGKDWYIGDIFINTDIINEQAQEINSDVKTEIKFLAMHGMLHLVGYDHTNPEEEEAMTFMQRKIFNELGIRDDKVI